MFDPVNPRRRLSRLALVALGVCVAGAVALAVADGFIAADPSRVSSMVFAWTRNFRSLFQSGIYAATLFWAVASLIERRTVLSVGFDRLDAGAMAVKGPDEANTVWIDRRYGARLEAEAVAALDSRLRDARERQLRGR